MTCTHIKYVRVPGEICRYTDEQLPDTVEEVRTTEDLDTGRFRCTQCGKVMYYTGLWRNFYERGIPCPGSELVKATT